MRLFCVALFCALLSLPCLSQTADTDPATKDDVILFFRTMHSYDTIHRLLEVQSQATEQLMHDQLQKKNHLPADFDTRMQKMMGELIKGMPVDEITEAMIPAYQKHFTRGDIAAMNAFYSSPVGQKVLQELPTVMQDGLQDMRPILSKYLDQWKERMQQEFADTDKGTNPASPPAKN